MLKTIVLVAISLILSWFAASQFAAQLEAVSAARAKRDEDIERRSLELGKSGRLVIAGIFAAVMVVLGFVSHFPIVSTIIALVISVALTAANIYLRRNGIRALPAIFLVWVGITMNAIAFAGYNVGESKWGMVYSSIQFILLVIMIISTLVLNANSNVREYIKEEKEARKLEREAKKAEKEQQKRQKQGTEERRKAATKKQQEQEEDESEDDDDYYEEDPFHEELIGKVVKGFVVVLIIALAAVIGFYLEWKFNFFPPY